MIGSSATEIESDRPPLKVLKLNKDESEPVSSADLIAMII